MRSFRLAHLALLILSSQLLNLPIAGAFELEAQSVLSGPGSHPQDARYLVHDDDVLGISFALSPELNQTVTVQPDGYISLTSVGTVPVRGLSIPQVVAVVSAAYKGVLHNPIVDVSLAQYQHPFFVVLGQVLKPGQYNLREDITISEALAYAGGLMPTAKTQLLLYRRDNDRWVEVKKVNLKTVLNGKRVEEDLQLKPGDMIFVPEKFITNVRKYIPYSIGAYLDASKNSF
jgi:polysaccharide export outer membrane protein